MAFEKGEDESLLVGSQVGQATIFNALNGLKAEVGLRAKER